MLTADSTAGSAAVCKVRETANTNCELNRRMVVSGPCCASFTSDWNVCSFNTRTLNAVTTTT